jgi:ABC-type Na+ efflux pump permease subunit
MDFIKKLFSGILSFLTGLLPGKKKSNGYFLELDEAKDAAKDAAKEVASSAKKVAETVTSNAKKVTTAIASEAPTQSKPDSLNGTKTAAQKDNAKSAKNPKPADVTLVQTAEGLKVEPGKKAKAAAAKVLKEEPKETTFAPKYLAPSVTSSNGRRRPGANMSAYLDMARQIKTSK